MSKIDPELTDSLEKAIAAGLSPQSMESFSKKIKDLSVDLEEDLMWSIKDNLAYNLSAWVADMAERAIEAMLQGNEDQMRRYLSCDKRGTDGRYTCYNGRTDGVNYGAPRDPAHPVIHGKLFETGAVELRKQVAQANEALIRDERIRDLEDQIKSLVAQVNKAQNEKENLLERLRRGEVVE